MWATNLTSDRRGRLTLLLTASYAGLALLSACGGGSTPSVGSPDPGPASCPLGIGGMPAGCCDLTGAALSPPPQSVAGCVNLNPGGGPIAGTGNKGAGSAGGSMNDIATAQGLVGGEVATGMGGQYAGATAGAQQPASALGNIAQLGPNTASSALNPSGSGGGGSGSGGSGSGTGLDNTSVSTAPAPGASGSPGVSGATADAVAYGANGNGAGGALPNGARSTGFQFGNGFSGEGAGGASELAFANSSGGGDAMLGGDPEDYFTRIGIEDSLFKKVERRYQATSMHWASADASSPSRSMASVPNVVPRGMAK
jgi:hypothetical protein